MKRSDIFSIVLIAIIGTVAAFLVCGAILGDPDEKTVTFKTIKSIEAELKEPDPELFNADAINPTVEVHVGNCVDVDRNGILDKAEMRACGKLDAEPELKSEEATKSDQREEN